MTSDPITLIPLLCIRCQAPVPANPGEVAWVCEQCNQGVLLDDTCGPQGPALRPLDVFFSTKVKPGMKGRPFWVTRGQASIHRRETYKGNESREAGQFWSSPRLFFIPAWECGLEEILSTGAYLLKNPERMEPGGPCRFLPVTSPPEDVQALAEFLVVTLEAERRDAMKEIGFSLKLDPPQLWVLP